MKCFYFYMDDQSNGWMVMRDKDAPEAAHDAIGPTGLPAVTMSEEPPVDECLITLRPAHRVADTVTKRTKGKTFYFLQLASVLDETQCVLSRQAYKWPEAIRIAEMFQGMKFEQARTLFVRRAY